MKPECTTWIIAETFWLNVGVGVLDATAESPQRCKEHGERTPLEVLYAATGNAASIPPLLGLKTLHFLISTGSLNSLAWQSRPFSGGFSTWSITHLDLHGRTECSLCAPMVLIRFHLSRLSMSPLLHRELSLYLPPSPQYFTQHLLLSRSSANASYDMTDQDVKSGASIHEVCAHSQVP